MRYRRYHRNRYGHRRGQRRYIRRHTPIEHTKAGKAMQLGGKVIWKGSKLGFKVGKKVWKLGKFGFRCAKGIYHLLRKGD
jgi:hypothetical protein